MLILMQNPAASHVAGFHTWKKEFGRNVKAHESGLKILAPCPYRRFIEQDKLDKDGKPVLDAAGKPLRERTLVQLMRFRIVTVFDISQTEGKELPSIGVSELNGDIAFLRNWRTRSQAFRRFPFCMKHRMEQQKAVSTTSRKKFWYAPA